MNAFIYNNNNELIRIESIISIEYYKYDTIFINKSKYMYNDFKQMSNLEKITDIEIINKVKCPLIIKLNY